MMRSDLARILHFNYKDNIFSKIAQLKEFNYLDYSNVSKESECYNDDISDTSLYKMVCMTKLGYSGCDQRNFCCYL